MLINTFRVFGFVIYVPWESDPGEEVMSVSVWECREGLPKQRPSSRGSPVPGERKGSPGKGQGSQCPPGKRLWTACDLDCDLGRDKSQWTQLTVPSRMYRCWETWAALWPGEGTRSPWLRPCVAVCQTRLRCPPPPCTWLCTCVLQPCLSCSPWPPALLSSASPS